MVVGGWRAGYAGTRLRRPGSVGGGDGVLMGAVTAQRIEEDMTDPVRREQNRHDCGTQKQ